MKKITLLIVVTLTILSGCQLKYDLPGNSEVVLGDFNGTIQTYDENGNVIDQLKGESIAFRAGSKFMKSHELGRYSGALLGIEVDGKKLFHVGSSLIFHEKGLENVFEKYAQKVNFKNFDRGTPFINKMVHDMKSTFAKKNQVILIRSQSGIPLAAFASNSISFEPTDVERMNNFKKR